MMKPRERALELIELAQKILREASENEAYQGISRELSALSQRIRASWPLSSDDEMTTHLSFYARQNLEDVAPELAEYLYELDELVESSREE